jgi:hypothetical protein
MDQAGGRSEQLDESYDEITITSEATVVTALQEDVSVSIVQATVEVVLTHVKEVPDQPNWQFFSLPHLQHLEATDARVLSPPDLMDECGSEEEALELLARCFGVVDAPQRLLPTAIGDILVIKEKLKHIVEKRPDARERYVNFALSALSTPYEVWKIDYDNGSARFAFLGVFHGKRQMLVVVDIQSGNVLWNFMHCERKSLNKHRQGTLIFPQ